LPKIGIVIDTPSSDTPEPSKKNALVEKAKHLPWLLVYLGLTFLLTRLVQDPANRPIDPSFQQAYSYFFLNATQIGKDYIFTYGPMGHFIVPRYHPDLFWLDYGVTIIIGLGVAWPVYRFLRTLKGRYWAQLAILIPIWLTAEVSAGSDIPALMSSILAVILLRDGQISSKWILGLVGVFWAFLALCKFTLMVLGVGFVGYVCIYYLLQRDWKRATLLPSVFFVSIVCFWIIARQDLANFIPFLVDSLEVSKAYVVGMIKDDNPLMFILVYAAIACVCVCAVASLKHIQASRLRWVVDGFFIGVMFFVLWRLGLTRNNTHESKFFLPMMILPFFVCGSAVLEGKGARLWKIATALLCVIGMVGYSWGAHWSPIEMVTNGASRIATTASHMVNPVAHHFDLKLKWLVIKKNFDLPEIRAVVGQDSVDIFSYEQRLLMFHEYNYSPRYVYQGYQACTAKLQIKNGESYWGTGSITPPEYIIYQQLQLDLRLPTTEDSQALLAMLYCYEAVMHEYGHVLYKRLPDPPSQLPESVSVTTGTLKLNDVFEVPDAGDEWQLLSLEFNQPLLKRLTEYPWEKTRFDVRVYYTDHSHTTFTLIPEMASAPFLIPPDATTPPDLINQFNVLLEMSAPGDKVIQSMQIVDRHGYSSVDEWAIDYTLTTIPAPPHKVGWSR
jgi:hypothetical protein